MLSKKFLNNGAIEELLAYLNLDSYIVQNNEDVIALNEIYHYTSPQAFVSIMENSNIWFTDSRFLNDIEEQYHIKYILENILNNYNNKLNKDIIQILETYSNNDNLKDLFNKNKRYIFSCSSAPDELSLWNYYTKKNTRGYAFSFSPSALLNSFNEKNKNNVIIHKCLYSQQEKEQYLLYSLEKANKALGAKAFQNNQKKEVLNLLEQSIFTLSTIFKNEKFANEKEIRFIYQANNSETNEIKYRLNNGILIPYIEFDFKKQNVIKNIIVGPGVQEECILESTKEFTQSLTGNSINILSSNIPVRTNWNVL